MSKVKEILKELYPDAELAKGLDFDRSGSIEGDEEIKNIDKNGRIDDVDYGILTFNNKEHFISSHGAGKWKELAHYWDEAAKRPRSVFANEPSIGNTKNPEKEELQRHITSSLYEGRENELEPAEVGLVLKKQTAFLDLQKRYPNLHLEKIDPSQVDEVCKSLGTIEEFSPNLAHKLRYIKKDLTLNACAGEEDDNAGAKALRGAIMGGCASNGGIVTNPAYDVFMGDELLIHESAHVYYAELLEQNKARTKLAEEALSGYARQKGYKKHAIRNNEGPRFDLPDEPIKDTLRDNIERHIELKKSGRPHDAELLRLYDNYLAARRGSFEYDWYHANDSIVSDAEFEEVEKAGQRYERASSELNTMLVRELGEEAVDPFWKDEFYRGGERSELTLKGHIRDKVGANQRLNGAIKEWEDSKKDYRRLASGRLSSNIVRVEVGDGEMVIFNKSTRNYGMPSLYAFTNDEETVAEVVRSAYVEKRENTPNDFFVNTKDGQKDRQMRENYVQVLRRHGFLK